MFSKKSICSVILILCLLFATIHFSSPSYAADSGLLQVEISGQFLQTEARSGLDLINAFRTSSEAWYWGEKDTDKVWFNGEGQTKTAAAGLRLRVGGNRHAESSGTGGQF